MNAISQCFIDFMGKKVCKSQMTIMAYVKSGSSIAIDFKKASSFSPKSLASAKPGERKTSVAKKTPISDPRQMKLQYSSKSHSQETKNEIKILKVVVSGKTAALSIQLKLHVTTSCLSSFDAKNLQKYTTRQRKTPSISNFWTLSPVLNTKGN